MASDQQKKQSTNRSSGTKSKQMYPKIIPPPAILGSLRPTKRRTSGSSGRKTNSWRDMQSTHSSMTSQTIASMTDVSSIYSVSQSSPGSHEERPKVVLQMHTMEPKLRRDSYLSPNQNSETTIPEVEGGSSSRSNHEDGESSSAGEEGTPILGEMSLRSGGSGRRDDNPQRWKAATNNSGRLVSSGASTGSSKRSVNSYGASSMGSRTSLADESQGKDSAASCPKRRPTLEEEAQESQRKNQADENLQYNEEDEETPAGPSEDSNGSGEDKLSPLMDPVSMRLRNMDTRHRVSSSSQQEKSVGTSSFSASYGSVSLGGETSLSSSDTFRNSPISTGKAGVRPLKAHHEPNLQAQPQRKILKANNNPNPIEWKRRSHQVREKYYRTSAMASETDSRSSSSSRISSLPAGSFSSRSSVSSSCWNEPLKSFNARDGSGRTNRRVSGTSLDSGDVTIATFSDGGSILSGDNSHSLPSVDQRVSKRSGFSSSTVGDGSKSKQSSESIGSSLVNSSWNNYPGHSDAVFNVTSEDEEKKHGNGTDDVVAAVSIKTPHSYASWTSSDEWSSPRQASDHWASQNWSQRHGELSEWTSGEDSSSSATDSDVESVDEEDEESMASPCSPLPPKEDQTDKPRSAFDKSAPWYCGDSDADSVCSDSSSILSGLKKKSPMKAAALKSMMPPATSEASMSLGDLDKPLSMSMSDLAGPREQKKEIPALLEESMSLGEFIDVEAIPASAKQEFSPKGGQGERLSKTPNKRKTNSRNKKPKAKSTKKEEMAVPLGHDDEDFHENPENSRETGEEILGNDNSKSILEKVKILDHPWCRRALYASFAIFLLFDLVLLILFLKK